jgi:hypothetical protein
MAVSTALQSGDSTNRQRTKATFTLEIDRRIRLTFHDARGDAHAVKRQLFTASHGTCTVS